MGHQNLASKGYSEGDVRLNYNAAFEIIKY